MSDKITGYGRSGVDIKSARAETTPRADKPRNADRAAADEKTREPATGGVRLTDTATNLKQIEARLRSSPDVDQSRVEALRSRIESGAYQVNAGRLADRLLAFERDRV